MGGAIIGINQNGRQNQAPDSAYESLYNTLNGQTGSAYFVVNGYGEALGPSANRNWSPRGQNGVAEFVRSGGIFIDYCGWPMYWQVSTSGVQSQNGPGGFQSFVQGINYPWLDTKQFQTPVETTFSASLSQFPLTRGFDKLGSMDGVYLANGTMVVPGGILSIGGGTFPIATQSYTAMMALHHPSIGWYFYGSYGRTSFGPHFPNAVPEDLYAAFILACLRGQSGFSSSGGQGGITYANYVAPVHKVTSPQPGPSSPYQGNSSGSGTATSSGSGTGSATVSTTTTAPSGNTSTNTSAISTTPGSVGPSALEIGAVAAGAVLVGLGGYWLLKG